MTLFPFSNGTSTLTDDQLGSNLSDPKVAEAFQVINDMIYVDGSMPMPEQGMDAAQLFAAGRLAMAAIGPNSVQNMLTADFTDWDVAYLPIQDKENGSHIFGVTGYGILKDTENPDMCWEVIKELVLPPAFPIRSAVPLSKLVPWRFPKTGKSSMMLSTKIPAACPRPSMILSMRKSYSGTTMK